MKNKILIIQMGITIIMFIMMISLSYFFTKDVMRKQLNNDSELLITYTANRLDKALNETKIFLEEFANNVKEFFPKRNLVDLQNYFNTMVNSIVFISSDYNLTGLSGYFLCPEKPILIETFEWDRDNFDITKRDWYQKTVDANGEIIETLLFSQDNAINDEIVYLLTKAIYIEDVYCGMIIIRLQLKSITNYILAFPMMEKGYGFIMDTNFRILSHPKEEYIGKKLSEIDFYFDNFNIKKANGHIITQEEGESVLYAKRTEHNLYVVMVTPKKDYYSNINLVLIFLIFAGIFFTLCLIVILTKIEKAKNIAIKESINKTNFLANMGYEIRDPLNTITGMSSMGKLSQNVEKKDYCFDKVIESSQYLLEIINNISDITEIESGKLKLNMEEFHFNKMVQKVLDKYKQEIEEKSITLEIIIDNSIPEVLIGDEIRLMQVLSNLLNNAVKFSPKKGKIKFYIKLLSWVNNYNLLEVSIKDQGPGISEGEKELLFAPYYQAKKNTLHNFSSTGLGLTICKKLIELMDGRIWANSKINRGSTFYFTLKLKKGDIRNLKPHHLIDNEEIFEDYDILIAEDMTTNQEILNLLLKRTGISIDFANNGKEALKMFNENPDKYDLILMDIQMPILNGVETTVEIRKINQKIPIIAMTAHIFMDDINQFMEAGMTDHVSKPINFEKLINMLKLYLLR